jgi:DNA-binding CsgD family transcriptional regulator
MGIMAKLTTREKEVVQLLARGQKPAQIARALSISRHTVYAHVQNARGKTGTGSGFELAVKAAAELRKNSDITE